MHYRHLLLICSLLFISLNALQAAEAVIRIGDSYKQVVKAIGKPDGDLSAASKRILTYGTAKVILRADKVTEVSDDLDSKLQVRNKNQESIEAKRKAGLVNYKGEWMKPEQVEALIHANAQEALKNRSKQSRNANSGIWYTNFKQAASLAKSQNKKMLINFTGSDWCGWCIKLDKEVFSQTSFTQHAAQNYILLRCDFPKRTKLPAALQTQNQTLAKKFGVREFPTIIVLKPDGSVYSKGGYVSGGPSAFLSSIR
ncbi:MULTISPECIES: thioredoxin family protein [unclassified Lentimonas]|uniref:thioredoxin family protein n=1 Tax=unclassified Lentimonas TaxID=2630993 RepID=UPI00132A22EB|nr:MULTISPECIES: thioredoxin family protein [unclassified Lentimonas]CAA6689619.1 Thioredoxin Disulfide Isomerase [Lentimonas sp. CC19]CAA6692608.1 Thioredoxin Disulfide Isomerase [Lentimonas sp. CC10]CAA7069217.1 Thioredoxin Disulfide Isomerase [Lentimonas sp. CC11]